MQTRNVAVAFVGGFPKGGVAKLEERVLAAAMGVDRDAAKWRWFRAETAEGRGAGFGFLELQPAAAASLLCRAKAALRGAELPLQLLAEEVASAEEHEDEEKEEEVKQRAAAAAEALRIAVEEGPRLEEKLLLETAEERALQAEKAAIDGAGVGLKDEEMLARIKAFRLQQARADVAAEEERKQRLAALGQRFRREREREERARERASEVHGRSHFTADENIDIGKHQQEEEDVPDAVEATTVSVKMVLKDSISASADKKRRRETNGYEEEEAEEPEQRVRKATANASMGLENAKRQILASKLREGINSLLPKYLGAQDEQFCQHVFNLIAAKDTTREDLEKEIMVVLGDEADTKAFVNEVLAKQVEIEKG